jgi:hypothetical protein
MVPKAGFRVFIYNKDGKEKLVNTWTQFEDHMQTGFWYASKEEIQKLEELDEMDDKVKKKGR